MRIRMSDCASQIVKLEPLPDVADAGTETHLMVNRSPSRCRSGGTGPRRVRARLPSPIQASAASGAPRCAEGAAPAVHTGSNRFSDGIGDLWFVRGRERAEIRHERAEIRLREANRGGIPHFFFFFVGGRRRKHARSLSMIFCSLFAPTAVGEKPRFAKTLCQKADFYQKSRA